MQNESRCDTEIEKVCQRIPKTPLKKMMNSIYIIFAHIVSKDLYLGVVCHITHFLESFFNRIFVSCGIKLDFVFVFVK